MKKSIKITIKIVLILIVLFIGLTMVSRNFSSFVLDTYNKYTNTETAEKVEMCKCLREYKKDMKCSRFGSESMISITKFHLEQSYLADMSKNNPVAYGEYLKMEVHHKLCEKKIEK